MRRSADLFRPWRALLLAAALACAAAAQAQRDPLDDPRFDTFGDARKINDGVVTALAQDGAGLIWVGTTVGLVRFDGYQLRPWPVGGRDGGRDGAPAGTHFVRSLLAAPDGQLWVGLDDEGLARLDIAAQRWTRYRPDPARPGALGGGSVRALAQERDGTLWVGTTGGGLHSLAPGATDFTAHRRASGAALPDDRVQTLLVDRAGTLWVGTWNGLARRAAGARSFETVLDDEGVPLLAGRTVSMLGQAPDGRLWVGTRQGELLVLDAAGGGVPGTAPEGARPRVQWLDRNDAPTAVGGAVVAMSAYGEQEVWVGREGGLQLRRTRDGVLIRALRRDLRRPWSVGGTNVVALLRDAAGGMWVGSYGGGLQRHSSGAGLWVRRAEGRDDSVFALGDVRSLVQLRDGSIWAGLSDRGIARFDGQLRLRGEIRPDVAGRAAGFRGGLVGAIVQAADGAVWVGSDTGIYEFDDQGRLRRSHGALAGRARRMLATPDGAVWVGTQDGVHRRAPGGRFERLTLADGSALGGNVNALVRTADGSVWVGGNAGLHVVLPGQTALQPAAFAPGAGLAKNVVLGLLVDRQDRLWVDTSAGLHRQRPGLHPSVQTRSGAALALQPVQPVQAVPAADSPAAGGPGPGSVGANLLEDAQGRIWTHQIVHDPADGSLHELTPADGADFGTGWFRAYTALADGRLLFGGSTGILVVEPARYRPWTYAPPLVVSELRIDGERAPLQRLAPALELPPHSKFSVEFAALDYGQTDRNLYRHRLVGVDRDWVVSGADFRVASYGNLPPGRYTLQVQGSNRVGRWSTSELQLPVTVLPAWWQTWWAQVLALLALGAAVVALVQGRTAMLRRQQVALEARVRERTLALQALSAELQHKSQALEAASLTDPLTGLHNRRFLAQQVEADVALALRRHAEACRGAYRGADSGAEPGAGSDGRAAPPDDGDLVFFLIDIDHFKQVNDQRGHAAGDAVLMQMRDRLLQAFRQSDHLVRWGGEEFLIVARDTSRERAADLAERARAAVAGTPFVLDDGSTLTRSCSVGFAAFPLDPAHPQALDWAATIDLADAALMAAKRAGRNAWQGLVQARADSAQALRAAAAGDLAAWAATGALRRVVSAPPRNAEVGHDRSV